MSGLIDANLRFSNAQAITATAVSTNVLDIASATRDIAIGTILYLIMNITTAFTDAGSDSTLTPTLEQDTADGFGSATVLATYGVFAALSAIGARAVVPLQPLLITERFLRLNYTIANGNLTTGSITSFLTTTPDLWVAAADGITITTP